MGLEKRIVKWDGAAWIPQSTWRQTVMSGDDKICTHRLDGVDLVDGQPTFAKRLVAGHRICHAQFLNMPHSINEKPREILRVKEIS